MGACGERFLVSSDVDTGHFTLLINYEIFSLKFWHTRFCHSFCPSGVQINDQTAKATARVLHLHTRGVPDPPPSRRKKSKQGGTLLQVVYRLSSRGHVNSKKRIIQVRKCTPTILKCAYTALDNDNEQKDFEVLGPLFSWKALTVWTDYTASA